MNRKELFEYKDNKAWLNTRLEKIKEEYNSLLSTSNMLLSGSKSSFKINDYFAESLVTLLDMKKETLDFAIKLEKKLHKVEKALLQLEQPYRNILTYRYIDGMSLVEVATKMKYSYTHICRQHGIALNKYDNLKDDMK